MTPAYAGRCRMNVLELFKPVSAFIFDVDGVLTDGTVLVLEGGLQARRMHIKDGFALQLACKNGYRIKVISGGHSPEVMDRLVKLGVTDVSMSVLDKRELVAAYMAEHRLKPEQVLYMGDDLPDLPAMALVGMPVCPSDAVREVRDAARYISSFGGGQACVRDVIETVLRLNGHWDIDPGVASR